MSKPWRLCPPVEPSPALVEAVGGHPLVARMLAQRGIDTPEKAIPFLDPNAYQPAPPTALTGVAEAAQILDDAIRSGSNILVWGDFDVDGQTSTALLVSALRDLAGDGHVRFHVPNRQSEGHGIRQTVLQERLDAADSPIHVLLTCDTGIAETDAVGYAKDRGLTVVITDHHDLASEFQGLTTGVDPIWGQPAEAVGSASVRRADAIVNPKFLPDGNALRTLPGVGVAYKLVQQLYRLAGRHGEDEEMLDLVALGIVADVAEQVHDARYLLQRGLERLRTTRRAGLQALMEVSRVNPASLTAESIGFQLGPRMNALGRLDDATVSVELLSTRDAIRAGQLAGKLERLNQERRLLTSQITRAAMDKLERDPRLSEYNGLVLADPNWHPGIVGIVASRMVEEFGKPAVLLVTPPGEPARGSARSIPGVDIGASIAACSHLLINHGGHPGAAGLSLLPENIDAFRRELSRQIELHRDESMEAGMAIDAVVKLDELSLELAAEIARLAPFGQGNPMPQLASYRLEVLDERRLGRDGSHRKLSVRAAGSEGPSHDVIWFGGADAELPSGPLDLLYTLSVNECRGERNLQLMYVDTRPARREEIRVAEPAPVISVRVHDWRTKPAVAADFPARATWYAEGTQLELEAAGVTYAPRIEITASVAGRPLVLWSIPPSGEILHWLVETAAPAEIYLCARPTTNDSLPELLRHVAGMCKYALGRTGRLDIGRMAARVGTTERIIRCCLLWLEARGEITLVEWLVGDDVKIAAGDHTPRPDAARELLEELETEVAEVRAYRGFVRRAKPAELGWAG
ncbi:MAG: DHH family phosphoesterase [Caldilineaceae bacterium]|nr:DHH family phosphoesterase [Caldilineaceae bacterium]